MNSMDWIGLPPTERAAHYRELAEEMRSNAAKAGSDATRKAYLQMAVEWLDMAEQLEAEYAKVSVTVQAPELVSFLRRPGPSGRSL
jgi:hypothetical protein